MLIKDNTINRDPRVPIFPPMEGLHSNKQTRWNKILYLFFFPFQTCAEAYDLLLAGEFGAAGSNSAESYRQVCQTFFPYATKFNLNSPESRLLTDDTTTTHNNNDVNASVEKITNNSPKAEVNEP